MFYTFIPNSFTPNNDNDNDLFFPSIIGHKSYNLKIYNRWGELIFDKDNGTWNGEIWLKRHKLEHIHIQLV